MYKINVNVSELYLIENKDRTKFNIDDTELLIVSYHGKSNVLNNYIDALEKSDVKKQIVVATNDIKQLKSDFKNQCITIKAAGGLVVNEKEEILFIFRRGMWDLPKGKMEKGETKIETALREVEEETGVKGLQIEKKLKKTRHFYRTKMGKRVIKISHWYKMKAMDQPLTPQVDEDIELAEWIALHDFEARELELYPSLYDVIDKYKKMLSEI